MNRQERAAIAERMYQVDETITIRQIAEQLGVSHTTIWKDLKARQVPMRPTPEQYRQQRQAQQFLRRLEKKRQKEQRRLAWEEESSEDPQLWQIERLISSL